MCDGAGVRHKGMERVCVCGLSGGGGAGADGGGSDGGSGTGSSGGGGWRI